MSDPAQRWRSATAFAIIFGIGGILAWNEMIVIVQTFGQSATYNIGPKIARDLCSEPRGSLAHACNTMLLQIPVVDFACSANLMFESAIAQDTFTPVEHRAHALAASRACVVIVVFGAVAAMLCLVYNIGYWIGLFMSNLANHNDDGLFSAFARERRAELAFESRAIGIMGMVVYMILAQRGVYTIIIAFIEILFTIFVISIIHPGPFIACRDHRDPHVEEEPSP